MKMLPSRPPPDLPIGHWWIVVATDEAAEAGVQGPAEEVDEDSRATIAALLQRDVLEAERRAAV